MQGAETNGRSHNSAAGTAGGQRWKQAMVALFTCLMLLAAAFVLLVASSELEWRAFKHRQQAARPHAQDIREWQERENREQR